MADVQLSIHQHIEDLNNYIENHGDEGLSMEDVFKIIEMQHDLISECVASINSLGDIHKSNLKFIHDLLKIITEKGAVTEEGNVEALFTEEEVDHLRGVMNDSILKSLE